MATKRIDYIDLAKGLCIILVAFHHMASYYNWDYSLWTALQSFRMPLYYFLSGLFFKEYGGFFDFFKRKTNKLLIPFLFFYLMSSIPLTIVVQHRDYIDALIAFTNGWDFENGCIWFLLSLFEINLIFYFVFILFKNSQWLLFLSVFSIGALGLMISPYEIKYRCFLDSSFTALPFFYLGFLLHRKTNFLNEELKIWQDLVFIIFSVSFLILFSSKQDFGQNVYSNYYLVYPCGIIGILMVFVVSKRLRSLPLVSYLGRYSIIVLCTHMVVMKVFRHLLMLTIIDESYTMWMNLIMTILSMLIIIPLCRRYIPYFTAQKDLINVA